MGVSAMQTPEKQLLPRAPTAYSQDGLLKWAQDLTRVLQTNLPSIARKANDDSTFTPVGDLNMGGHSITNIGDLGNITGTITYKGADIDTRYVNTSGDAMTGGLSFGAVTGASISDTSKHIALFSTNYGFGITASSFNHIANVGATHNFVVGSASIGDWNATRLKSTVPLDISASGAGQIVFPATQNASANVNTLDDYEEGSFTPAFAATGSTFSYASQTGFYTKIGDTVFYDLLLQLNTSGNTLAAAGLTITGLPYVAASTVRLGYFPVRWTASTSSFVVMNVRNSGPGSAVLIVEGQTAAATSVGGVLASTGLHATNGSTMRVSGFYRAA